MIESEKPGNTVEEQVERVENDTAFDKTHRTYWPSTVFRSLDPPRRREVCIPAPFLSLNTLRVRKLWFIESLLRLALLA